MKSLDRNAMYSHFQINIKIFVLDKLKNYFANFCRFKICRFANFCRFLQIFADFADLRNNNALSNICRYKKAEIKTAFYLFAIKTTVCQY